MWYKRATTMASDDWFRNKDWSPAVEGRFFEKLRRARKKASYLRIQASYLRQSHPKVALALLEQYFALGDDFELASAFEIQATAYLSLGDVEQAVKSYESALEREHEFPSLRTTAWLDFPILVASQKIRTHYATALDLLSQHKSEITFPVDEFKYCAAHALINMEQGDLRTAREFAVGALRAAELDHSGFRYHAKSGLVGNHYEAIESQLLRLVAN
jgi:tetratricopeptide (TPR) repeat protein